ncbi:membrane-bound lytic murein transglycosylase B [Actinomycetospora succinea]|uniref:Membrane-bound lytic murein transglycosylase B n=1 Tax=Actinomycetospora succinea TaxID=663603 RepID=A0A4R6VD09_9PSEU|nr:lytic murein transglycosylase [Actinomycetospora succinea]TDQ58584.1 membrane-bound lytic murein transglycosylase B [Actinomycetospora succinea]
MTTTWRPLPEELDRPPEELDLTDPPVPERRRTALLAASVLAIPVLAAAVSFGLPGTEAVPHPSAQIAPAPIDVGALGATGVAPGAWTPPPTPPAPIPAAAGPVDATGIPGRVLQAYRGAESALGTSAPSCRLPWTLVAAIGRVESDHAGGGAVSVDGRTLAPIRGPRLDGTGGHPFLVDTDAGRLDGDPGVDLAAGPMQFLPSSWQTYGADGDGDGAADVDDVDDAAVGSGRHLCAGGPDLSDPGQRAAAVFAYNRSDAYVAQVLAIEAAYAAGAPAPELPAPVSSAVPGVPTEPGPDALAIAPASPPATPAPAPSVARPAPTTAPTTTTPATTEPTPPVTTAPTPEDADPSPLFGAP